MFDTDQASGFLAASLVLLTFCMQSMVWLRLIALLSNVAFLAYAAPLGLLPVLALHLLLVPVNLVGLWQALARRGTGRRGRQRSAGPVVMRRRALR